MIGSCLQVISKLQASDEPMTFYQEAVSLHTKSKTSSQKGLSILLYVSHSLRKGFR